MSSFKEKKPVQSLIIVFFLGIFLASPLSAYSLGGSAGPGKIAFKDTWDRPEMKNAFKIDWGVAGVSVITSIATAGLGNAISSAITSSLAATSLSVLSQKAIIVGANMAVQGTIQGLSSKIQGENFHDGFWMGAVTGGVSSVVGLRPTWGPAAGAGFGALVGAGAGCLIYDDDAKGAMMGGLAGFSAGLGAGLNNPGKPPSTPSATPPINNPGMRGSSLDSDVYINEQIAQIPTLPSLNPTVYDSLAVAKVPLPTLPSLDSADYGRGQIVPPSTLPGSNPIVIYSSVQTAPTGITLSPYIGSSSIGSPSSFSTQPSNIPWEKTKGFIKDWALKSSIGFSVAQHSRLAGTLVTYHYNDKIRALQLEARREDWDDEKLDKEVEKLQDDMVLWSSVASGVAAGAMTALGSVIQHNAELSQKFSPEALKAPDNPYSSVTTPGGRLTEFGKGAVVGGFTGLASGLALTKIKVRNEEDECVPLYRSEDSRLIQLTSNTAGTVGAAFGQSVVRNIGELSNLKKPPSTKPPIENPGIKGSPLDPDVYIGEQIAQTQILPSPNPVDYGRGRATPPPADSSSPSRSLEYSPPSPPWTKRLSLPSSRSSELSGVQTTLVSTPTLPSIDPADYRIRYPTQASTLSSLSLGLDMGSSSSSAPISVVISGPDFSFLGLETIPFSSQVKPVSFQWNQGWTNKEGEKIGRWEVNVLDVQGKTIETVPWQQFKQNYQIKSYVANSSLTGGMPVPEKALRAEEFLENQKKPDSQLTPIGGDTIVQAIPRQGKGSGFFLNFGRDFRDGLFNIPNISHLGGEAVKYLVYQSLDKIFSKEEEKKVDLPGSKKEEVKQESWKVDWREGIFDMVSSNLGDHTTRRLQTRLSLNVALGRAQLGVDPITRKRMEEVLKQEVIVWAGEIIGEEMLNGMKEEISSPEGIESSSVSSGSGEFGPRKNVELLVTKLWPDLSQLSRKERVAKLVSWEPPTKEEVKEYAELRDGVAYSQAGKEIAQKIYEKERWPGINPFEEIETYLFDAVGNMGRGPTKEKVKVKSAKERYLSSYYEPDHYEPKQLSLSQTMSVLGEISEGISEQNFLNHKDFSHLRNVFIQSTLPTLISLGISDLLLDNSSRSASGSSAYLSGGFIAPVVNSVFQWWEGRRIEKNRQILPEGALVRYSSNGSAILYDMDINRGNVLATMPVDKFEKKYEIVREIVSNDYEPPMLLVKKRPPDHSREELAPAKFWQGMMDNIGRAQLDGFLQTTGFGHPGANPSAYSFARYLGSLSGVYQFLSKNWQDSNYFSNIYNSLGEKYIANTLTTFKPVARLFLVTNEYKREVIRPQITLPGETKFDGLTREKLAEMIAEGEIHQISIRDLPRVGEINEEWVAHLSNIQSQELFDKKLISFELFPQVAEVLEEMGINPNESRQEVVNQLMAKLEQESPADYNQLLGGDTQLLIGKVKVAESGSREIYVYKDNPFALEHSQKSRYRLTVPGPLPLREKDMSWKQRVSSETLGRLLTKEITSQPQLLNPSSEEFIPPPHSLPSLQKEGHSPALGLAPREGLPILPSVACTTGAFLSKIEVEDYLTIPGAEKEIPLAKLEESLPGGKERVVEKNPSFGFPASFSSSESIETEIIPEPVLPPFNSGDPKILQPKLPETTDDDYDSASDRWPLGLPLDNQPVSPETRSLPTPQLPAGREAPFLPNPQLPDLQRSGGYIGGVGAALIPLTGGKSILPSPSKLDQLLLFEEIEDPESLTYQEHIESGYYLYGPVSEEWYDENTVTSKVKIGEENVAVHYVSLKGMLPENDNGLLISGFGKREYPAVVINTKSRISMEDVLHHELAHKATVPRIKEWNDEGYSSAYGKSIPKDSKVLHLRIDEEVAAFLAEIALSKEPKRPFNDIVRLANGGHSGSFQKKVYKSTGEVVKEALFDKLGYDDYAAASGFIGPPSYHRERKESIFIQSLSNEEIRAAAKQVYENSYGGQSSSAIESAKISPQTLYKIDKNNNRYK